MLTVILLVFELEIEEPAVLDGNGAVVVLSVPARTDVLETCIVVAVCEGAP